MSYTAGRISTAKVVQEPFPHLVVDELYSAPFFRALSREAAEEWGRYEWKRYMSQDEEKWGSDVRGAGSTPMATAVAALTYPATVEALRKKFGLPEISADTKLYGAGFHRIERGGHLGVHVDFNRATSQDGSILRRRVNVIAWIHPEWDPNWGGGLELYPSEAREVEDLGVRRFPCGRPTVVECLPNRLVAFVASDWSWHGHPRPLECPVGTRRLSLATYYYSLPIHELDQWDRTTTVFATPEEA